MANARIRITLLALGAALALACAFLLPAPAWAATTFTVTYTNADSTPHSPTVIDPTNVLDGDAVAGTPLAATLTTWGATGQTTWYVVEAMTSITISERIETAGDVRLVLLDGSTLTAQNGIAVNENASLTIYGQGNGTGKLVSTYDAVQSGAAIGSDTSHAPGAISLLGGMIHASTGVAGGAAIGGGYECAGNIVTIARGTVLAETGALGGAGIGAGSGSSDGGSLVITGGNVQITTTNAQVTNGTDNGGLRITKQDYPTSTDYYATSTRFTYYDTAGSNSFNGAYVAWIPACAVAFDSNGGSGTMPTQPFAKDAARNLTPCAFTCTGYAFAGWSDSRTATLPTYLDGASFSTNTDTTLYAVWNRIIDEPTPVQGLVYNGQPQIGVSTNARYVLSNASATNAGEYTATATPAPGYCWSDGSTEAREIAWSIAPAPLTVLGAQATGRVYEEGNTTVTISGGTLDGVIAGEAVTLGGAPLGTMTSDSAGTNKPITVSGYTLVGDSSICANYALQQPTDLVVNIEKAPVEYTAPMPAPDLVYNGTSQELVTAGTVTGGTITYYLNDVIQEEAPRGIDAGKYSITWIITSDSNHTTGASGVITGSFDVNIAQATPAFALNGTSDRAFPNAFTITFNADSEPKVNVKGAKFSANVADGKITITPRETGTATVTVATAKTKNYEASAHVFTLISTTGEIQVTVNAPALTYTGSPQSLGSISTIPANATVKYGTTADECTLSSAPSRTVIGTYTTYYTVEAPYYTTKTGSWQTTISAPGGDTPTISQAMYRLYNPNGGEHFYTASAEERDGLRKLGWKYEGIGWKAPVFSNTPVYRLYNPNGGDHHYTSSAEERDWLRGLGWKYEGIGWYSDDNKTTPLYRLYNPNAKSGSHHYTTSASERDGLRKLGWHYEGIGWYGL
ncbi:InlB B-repeat-containing protein [Denitrobacterium detoxificans]|uniref:InlB B-repeat-containing protein n=1 Tax=Denitrobacterium detoxificans TaxID=79604 RepID=UPI000AD04233|nr:InlB B-repeat-containing protein [Denitrobacterium detoxificans]